MNVFDAPATIGSCAVSIRELGEMMQAADRHPDHRERLAELERLTDRIQARLSTVKDLVVAEYLDQMGGA